MLKISLIYKKIVYFLLLLFCVSCVLNTTPKYTSLGKDNFNIDVNSYKKEERVKKKFFNISILGIKIFSPRDYITNSEVYALKLIEDANNKGLKGEYLSNVEVTEYMYLYIPLIFNAKVISVSGDLMKMEANNE